MITYVHSFRLVGVWCAALLALGACSSNGSHDASPTPMPLTSAEESSLGALAVGAGQLPPLKRTSKALTRQDVADAAALDDLDSTLVATGFRGGLEIEYRGKSDQLTGVESQVLAFSTAQGAATYGRYLSENAGGFFGEPTGVKPMKVDGRSGWSFDPPLCNCAGAQPFVAGAVTAGNRVLVLQITGPEADVGLLRRLMNGKSS